MQFTFTSFTQHSAKTSFNKLYIAYIFLQMRDMIVILKKDNLICIDNYCTSHEIN